MEIRWKVGTFTYTVWDNNMQCHRQCQQKNKPILQYFDGYQWKDVPTDEVEVK